MRLPIPRSLAGRLMLVLGSALFVAQLINFALILNERQKLSLSQNVGPAVTRFASAAADVSDAEPQFREFLLHDLSRRGAQYSLRSATAIDQAERAADVEKQLAEALASAGVSVRALHATEASEPTGHLRPDGQNEPRRTLTLEAQLASGQWLGGTLPVPARDPWLGSRLAGATAALFLIVLGASLIVIRQVTSPLQALAQAAHAFRGKAAPKALEPEGPEDMREAIHAFNEMNERLIGLLDEKDRFLGAIGHDLRTPLASLRIRVEAMEPEAERLAAVRKIEEMTGILEDILMLAKTGRARAEMRPADVGSIVEAVVEDFREQGKNVNFAAGQPVILPVHPGLLARAVSNLLDNAVKYGGRAEANIRTADEDLFIEITDDGPGVSAADLVRLHEPFYRAEPSRSRETGGSGLGLSIARSIAEIHGGALVLANCADGGFIAGLRLPL